MGHPPNLKKYFTGKTDKLIWIINLDGSSPVVASYCHGPCQRGFASGIVQQGRLGRRWGLAILSLRGVEPLGDPIFFSVVLLKVGIHWHDRKQGPDFFFQNLRRKFSVTTWSLGPTASVSMLPWTSVRNAGNGESLWTFGIRCHRGVFREASFRLEVLSVPWREHWAREIWGVHSS